MSKKKNIRTKGAKSQWKFDNILSDLKDDELDFMSLRYNKELLYYRTHNDMNKHACQQEYLEMQQRKKMINEEIRNRRAMKTHIDREEIRFYPSEGTIIDSDNNVLETIAYNYDETEIITLPSGTKGKGKKPEWEPKIEPESEVPYTMMSDVELSWSDWIKKHKLDG